MVDGIEWGGGGRHNSAILRGGGPYYIFLEDMFQFDMRVRMAYLPPRILKIILMDHLQANI